MVLTHLPVSTYLTLFKINTTLTELLKVSKNNCFVVILLYKKTMFIEMDLRYIFNSRFSHADIKAMLICYRIYYLKANDFLYNLFCKVGSL